VVAGVVSAPKQRGLEIRSQAPVSTVICARALQSTWPVSGLKIFSQSACSFKSIQASTNG